MGVLSLNLSLATRASTVFVTDHPSEMPQIEGALVCTNIFEAIYDAPNGATILIDKRCHLPTMADSCAEGKKRYLVKQGNEEAFSMGNTVGGIPQENVIYLGGYKEIHLKGTPRGSIVNRAVCIWTDGGELGRRMQFKLSTLRIECLATCSSAGAITPAIVNGEVGNEHATLIIDSCNISSSAGPPLHISGQTVLTNSTISLTGAAVRYYGVVYMRIHPMKMNKGIQNCDFRGNVFKVYRYPVNHATSHSRLGFRLILGDEEDRPTAAEWQKMLSLNTVEALYPHTYADDDPENPFMYGYYGGYDY